MLRTPEDEWFDFYTGELVSTGGAVKICRNANDPLPIFAPDGAVVPMEENGKTVSQFWYAYDKSLYPKSATETINPYV